ncbi:MAG TPA: creatininase family protein [Anaerolineales bacterium]|nr:creatininase family protein [Anaerolineales bacterium]
MRFEDLNWMDVESYLKNDDRLIVVLGACEEHGYLSLLTDIRIPMALADAASARTNVLVAPPLNFGISPYFAKYPGTISLRTQTFLAVIEDIVRWVYGQGFRRLLFVNGHGGNNPATGVLAELVNELPGLEVDWYAWWVAPAVQAVAADVGLHGTHANWLEAFPFCRVAELPDGVKPPTPAARAILNADETKATYGDGVFGGGPYKADDAVMQWVFDAAVADVVERLKFE